MGSSRIRKNACTVINNEIKSRRLSPRPNFDKRLRVHNTLVQLYKEPMHLLSYISLYAKSSINFPRRTVLYIQDAIKIRNSVRSDRLFEGNEDAEKAIKILDKYDFSEILKNANLKNVYDVIDDICFSQMSNEEIEFAFNELSFEEAATYFKERYNMHCHVITRYYMSWNKTIKA